jgi:hypothetical protein
MLGSLSYALGRLPFSHKIAQYYELLSAQRSIRRAGGPWLTVARDAREDATAPRHGAVGDQWFCGNEPLFAEFIAHVKDRANLEIGSGPMGHLASRPWMRRRIVVDPLIEKYRSYQLRRFGDTVWTGDIETHACAAENVIPELRDAIDGSIICRNALDHTEDPLSVLSAISQYATPGCYLLLWSDIWHSGGVTIGHRNITRSPAAMDALLTGFGFDIIQNGAQIRAPGKFVEYGRLARKRPHSV